MRKFDWRTAIIVLLFWFGVLIGKCSAQILSGQHRQAGGTFSGHYLDAISGSGSDSANGLTPATAWATLAHADATLTTNDPTLHVRYPDGNYYSVAPVWHNMLSYYPLQQGTFSGASATTCYDVYNGHNGTLGSSGTGGGAIWKYAGLVVGDAGWCSVPNFSNLFTSGNGGGISVQTNFFDASVSTYAGEAFSIYNGGAVFNLHNPYSAGTSYFNFGSSINYSQDPVALANQQHVWAGLCGGGNQYYYLDTTQEATAANSCTFSLSNVPLMLGYIAGGANIGMSGILSGSMFTASTLANSDYLTLESWFTGTEIPRIQHAPAPTTPGRPSKPVMEWNNYDVYNGAATCQNVKDNALAATTGGWSAVGYNFFGDPVPWSTSRSGGSLVTDATKCPLGIADLFTYIHGLGLKTLHYLTVASPGCVSQEPSLGNETTDATQAASFGADEIAYDNCSSLGSSTQADYQAMSTAMIATGRPMYFYVSNGTYANNAAYWCSTVGGGEIQTGAGNAPPITWSGVLGDTLSTNDMNILPWAKTAPLCIPWINGLGVGNGTLTDQEGQADFAIYTTFGASLVLGIDLTAPPSATTIRTLQNVEAIAVDQDTAGFGGLRQNFSCGGSNLCQLYVKQMSGSTGNAKWIFTIVNQASSSQSVTVNWGASTALADITGTFYRRDLWALWPSSCTSASPGYTCASNLDVSPVSSSTVTVPSHGASQIALCSSQCTAL